MPKGGRVEAELYRRGRDYGISLSSPQGGFLWLTNRGHCNQRLQGHADPSVIDTLRAIFDDLEGDESVLQAKGERSLKPDLLLGDYRLLEIDESQHFTTARLTTLTHYDEATAAGFGLKRYRDLCEQWRERSDRDFSHRAAAEFPGRHGRQRQRAYFDAVRDLAAPACGQGTVVRLPVPGRHDDADDALTELMEHVRSSAAGPP